MKINVLNRPADAYTSTWEGQTRERSRQWCSFEIDGLVNSFQVTVDPGKEFAPGEYTLAPESFGITNGRLTLARVVLKPVTKPASAKAA